MAGAGAAEVAVDPDPDGDDGDRGFTAAQTNIFKLVRLPLPVNHPPVAGSQMCLCLKWKCVCLSWRATHIPFWCHMSSAALCCANAACS